jgi:hypothetical protein
MSPADPDDDFYNTRRIQAWLAYATVATKNENTNYGYCDNSDDVIGFKLDAGVGHGLGLQTIRRKSLSALRAVILLTKQAPKRKALEE